MKGVMNGFTSAALVAVLVAVILVVGALIYFFWPLKIELPDMSPPNNAGAKVAEFPPRASQAVVTVRLPFIPLRDLALQKIPTRIEGERQVPDQGGFSGIHINPNLNIGPTTLEPEVNSSPPRIKLTTRIHGSVGVRAFKWIIIDLLIDTLKTKSPEVSETIDVDATVSGWVSPGLDGGWNFTHQEHFDVTVNKAEVVILGVIPISLKDKVQEIVNQSAAGIIASALDSIRASLPIRAEVEKAWKELFKVVQVETDPNVYLSFVPEKVRLQTASFESADFLTLRVALDGNLQALIASETPVATSPSPLPDLLIEPVDPAFHVYLPVGLELTEANRALAKASPKDRGIRLDDDAKVSFATWICILPTAICT